MTSLAEQCNTLRRAAAYFLRPRPMLEEERDELSTALYDVLATLNKLKDFSEQLQEERGR